MRYYIIAGEASGDLHASNLIRSLRDQDPEAEVRGWGGDLMKEAGADIVRHYKDTAIMGFFTVLKNLGKIKHNLMSCRQDILEWRPDVVILVDYGGFNLRLAKLIKPHGIPLFYYISPKIWAWNTGRVHKIKRLIDRMYVIFPFEIDFYKKYDYTVFYCGNPLVDAIENRSYKDETFESFTACNQLPDKPIVALVAGSRSQELKNMLPKMLEMVDLFPDYQFVIAGAPSMTDADYAPYLKDKQLPIVYDQTYRLLQQARAALVTSGTATLETAILKTPQVVCYSGEGGAFYYAMFKLFVKVKYISLVNLIADREIVRELLMQQLNRKNLYRELSAILPEGESREQMLQGYDELGRRLEKAGASKRFARMMIDALRDAAVS